MKIALIGHGKMGQIIGRTALERGHSICCIIDKDEQYKFAGAEFASADVAIEFSTPQTAVGNILASFAAGVPVVCGTTGWLSELGAIRKLCDQGNGALFYASNFSVGVNIFFAMNRWLADVMRDFPQYRAELTEVHHIHKLDHPSGTAISIAEDIVASGAVSRWVEIGDGVKAEGEEVPAGVLPVWHERRGEVPGIHSVNWSSDCDDITITHSARSRQGFASGAVMAAEWMNGKGSGFYGMSDMLPFLKK